VRYFPLFLDLNDRKAVVVGGGEEALRKVRLLLKTKARVSVIAPALHEELNSCDIFLCFSTSTAARPSSSAAARKRSARFASC
jgi:siroheme synthase (precorrin-2 oxidase/ferrochelatase)